MKPTVFISSTFTDLKEHRNQVWKVVQEFDINIKGMEQFGARKESPLETCLNEIDESDIYIGIISMRYGSIDSMTGKSYTQLEYERALEKNLDILIYLIDERNGIVKTGDIDFGEKQEKLKEFKSLLNKHTVDIFINEIDLAQKIHKKLSENGLLISDGNFRPDELDAIVEIFNVDDKEFIMLLGLNNRKLFEVNIFNYFDNDGLLLPQSIGNGKLIKTIDVNGETRYDFRFLNKRGYKTTIEGINSYYNKNSIWLKTLSDIISELLQQNNKIKTIVKVINGLEIKNKRLKGFDERVTNILEKHSRSYN